MSEKQNGDVKTGEETNGISVQLESFQHSDSIDDFDLIRSKSSDVILTTADDDDVTTEKEKTSEFFGVTETPPAGTSFLLAFQVSTVPIPVKPDNSKEYMQGQLR